MNCFLILIQIWTRHTTNIELYGNLPKITVTLKERLLSFIGMKLGTKVIAMGTITRKEKMRQAQIHVDQLMRDDTGMVKVSGNFSILAINTTTEKV